MSGRLLHPSKERQPLLGKASKANGRQFQNYIDTVKPQFVVLSGIITGKMEVVTTGIDFTQHA